MISRQKRENKRQHCPSSIHIVFLVYMFTNAGYGIAQEAPPEIPPEIQERLDRLTAPPPTHYHIEVGEQVFRVPVEYVTQYPPDRDFFSMQIYWPGMVPYKRGIPEGIEDRLQIFVREGSVEEIEQVAENAVKRLIDSGKALIEDAEVSGLTSSMGSSSITQFHFDESVGSILNQKILMIYCRPAGGLHKVGTCSTRFSPIPGIAVMMRFDRETLPLWREVLSQVSQLIKVFKDDSNDL